MTWLFNLLIGARAASQAAKQKEKIAMGLAFAISSVDPNNREARLRWCSEYVAKGMLDEMNLAKEGLHLCRAIDIARLAIDQDLQYTEAEIKSYILTGNMEGG